VRSKATPRFWKLHNELPAHIQKLARKNYELWREDHNHPSLMFKKLAGGGRNRFSVRIGDHHRAVGHLAGDTVEWIWIGSHEDYNNIV
jgi:hypothetical protein